MRMRCGEELEVRQEGRKVEDTSIIEGRKLGRGRDRERQDVIRELGEWLDEAGEMEGTESIAS